MRISAVMQTVISSSAEVMGGAPVFKNTRVPIQTLLDYLEQGDSIDNFLQDFPTVSREQAIRLLEEAKQKLLSEQAHA